MTDDEFRDFMQEQALRHERASRSVEAWLRVESERTKEMIRKGEESREELRALREEMREEGRAYRAALFQILDRLSDIGPPPARA